MVWNEELKREIPERWKVGALSDLGDIIGGSTPPKEIDEYFSNQGTAWITPKDLSMNGANKFITKGEIDVSDKGLKAASLKIMPKGTILLSSRAPIGYMAIAREDVTTNQGFKSFIPRTDYTTPFIFYTIKNSLPEIVNNASGSTFKAISGGTLKTIKTCLPARSTIENFTDKVSPIFERQNILELENQQLSELRDWLLPMLMNGQVTVGETTNIEIKKVERNIYPINMQKLLHVARELHLRGYEKLRVVPSLSPSGMSWRCSFVAEPDNGIVTSTWLSEYSPNEREIEYSIIELTELFEREHMRFLESCNGKNKDYVEWYQNMLCHLEEDELPYAFADYFSPTDYWKTTNDQKIETLPNEKNFYNGY